PAGGSGVAARDGGSDVEPRAVEVARQAERPDPAADPGAVGATATREAGIADAAPIEESLVCMSHDDHDITRSHLAEGGREIAASVDHGARETRPVIPLAVVQVAVARGTLVDADDRGRAGGAGREEEEGEQRGAQRSGGESKVSHGALLSM